MNYYPYYSYLPTAIPPSAPAATGLFSRLFRNGINWGSIVNNTQKTLNIINQAIPVVKQVSPVVKNAKTMFKVMNEFKKVDANSSAKNTKINSSQINTTTTADKQSETTTTNTIESGPIFFA